MKALRTRSSNPQFVAPVDNPERLTRRVADPPPSRSKEDRPTGCRQNTLDGGELISRLLEGASDRIETDQDSMTMKVVALELAPEGFLNQLEAFI